MENNKLYSSAFWKFLERLLSQGLGIVVQIIIARIVNPSIIGEMAIIISVVNILNVFVQGGFSTYLVQKKELNKNTIATIFSLSLSFSLVSIAAVFFFGKYFLNFFGYGHLFIFLLVLSFVLIINSVICVFNGLLMRNMRFREIFFRSVIALPFSAAVCFILIFLGHDLWALVAYNFLNPFITMLVLIFVSRKDSLDLRLCFNREEIKDAFPFIGRILLQDIGNVVCNSVRNFSIGKYHSSDDLAYSDRAYTYTGYVQESITYTASSVLLPVLSRSNESKEMMENYIIKSLEFYSFLVIPALFGFAAIAPTFVSVVLTDKWSFCVPFIFVFAIGFLFYPFQTVEKAAFLSIKRSGVTLAITISQNIITLICIFAFMKFEPIYIAIVTSCTLLMYIPLYVIPTKIVFKISIIKQFLPFLKYLAFSTIMFLPVYFLNFLDFNGILKLILQLLVGITVYLILSIVTKDRCLKTLVDFIKRRAK